MAKIFNMYKRLCFISIFHPVSSRTVFFFVFFYGHLFFKRFIFHRFLCFLFSHRFQVDTLPVKLFLFLFDILERSVLFFSFLFFSIQFFLTTALKLFRGSFFTGSLKIMRQCYNKKNWRSLSTFVGFSFILSILFIFIHIFLMRTIGLDLSIFTFTHSHTDCRQMACRFNSFPVIKNY